MTEAMSELLRIARDEDGVTTIEYALMAALIAITCFLAVSAFGVNLRLLYTKVCNEVTSAISGAPAC